MNARQAALAAEYRRRLLAPDYTGFATYYGCAVPPELRRFYDLKDRLLSDVHAVTVQMGGKVVRIDLIQYAEPMNSDNWSYRYGLVYYRFATSVDGYPLLIKPSVPDSLVFSDFYHRDDDPYDIEDLGFTLKQIVTSLRNDG